MAIDVSDVAMKHAHRLREKEGQAADAFLRIGVKGGGCSGFSYVIKFDTVLGPDDQVVRETDDLKVVIDPKSVRFLDGMRLNFSDGLNGKGFEFENPNAKSSCGCGQSFSV